MATAKVRVSSPREGVSKMQQAVLEGRGPSPGDVPPHDRTIVELFLVMFSPPDRTIIKLFLETRGSTPTVVIGALCCIETVQPLTE